MAATVGKPSSKLRIRQLHIRLSQLKSYINCSKRFPFCSRNKSSDALWLGRYGKNNISVAEAIQERKTKVDYKHKHSTSDKKLNCFGITFHKLQKRKLKTVSEANESEYGYLFVQQLYLQSLVGQLLCPAYQRGLVDGVVSVPDTAIQGFVAKYVLCCTYCKHSIDEKFPLRESWYFFFIKCSLWSKY